MSISLKNLYEHSMQEIFDVVCAHLLTQNAKSQVYRPNRDEMVCVYRTPKGLKCAVGCLIADDEYKENIEGLYVQDLLVKLAMPKKLMLEDTHKAISIGDMLRHLQQVHDDYEPAEWPEQLKFCAKQYRLSYNTGKSPCATQS